MTDLNRGPEAEALLADELAAATGDAKNARSNDWRGSRAEQALSQLALLYHRCGRYEDVLHLLENAPDWGAADVSALFDNPEEGNVISLMWLHTGFFADAGTVSGGEGCCWRRAQKWTGAKDHRRLASTVFPALIVDMELLLVNCKARMRWVNWR